MHMNRAIAGCTRCLVAFLLSVILSPAPAGELPVHRVQPSGAVVLYSLSSDSKEFFIGETAEPAKADLHLLYTGDKPFKCRVVLGGDELPPASFGMRYEDGWIQVGADGGASGANGRRFALRQAMTRDGQVEWAIDQSLSAGEEFGIFEKVGGQWVKAARIVCGTVQAQPAKIEPAPASKPTAPETAPPAAPLAIPHMSSEEVKITGVAEEPGELVASLHCAGLNENTVVQGELVPQHSGLVSQSVAGIVPADKAVVLRFREPFLGWPAGRYIIQVRVDGNLKAKNTIDLIR